MARRTLNEPTKELNKNVGGLLKETNEAGKLGSILDLIEQQQQDLLVACGHSVVCFSSSQTLFWYSTRTRNRSWADRTSGTN